MTNNPTDTNQASEDDLRDKLEEPIETLLNHLGERDNRDNWWGHDTNVGTLEGEIEDTIESLMRLIRNEKLKLLAEVRERVVGEDVCTCGCNFGDGCLCLYKSYLRHEQYDLLDKLEAEL